MIGHGHPLDAVHHPRPARLWTPALIGRTAALSIAAIAWGLVNFGLLLWLPSDLVAKGYSIGVSSRLLAQSALIAFPTVFACAALYSRWSTKWSLALTLVADPRRPRLGASARGACRAATRCCRSRC